MLRGGIFGSPPDCGCRGMDSEYFAVLRRSLVEKLKREGMLFDEWAERAMLRVPRELFVPEEARWQAYEDYPLPIGRGQTISAPHMVAYMTSLARPRPGMRVLEVGTGSGYQAAVLAEAVAPGEEGFPRGHVFSVERIPELAERARENLRQAGYDDRVTVVVGDGSKGLSSEAPYDIIMVTAAARRIPERLVEQLADGGVMVIPVGEGWEQWLVVVEKRGGKVFEKRSIPVLFVPLVED